MHMQPATGLTPALIVYLIDASDSMNQPCGKTTKMDVVNTALRKVIRAMVGRSLRDGVVQSRYRIAIFAYSTKVVPVTNGIHNLADFMDSGIPSFEASGQTDTAGGFEAVEKLLQIHLAEYQRCPAPLICHLTDGSFTTNDPGPIIRRIQAMQVNDGAVLVENIYIAENMFRKPVQNWKEWPGVQKIKELNDDYARYLYTLSSPLPETYRRTINNYGYQLQSGTKLFFPGFDSDLMQLAFTISAATELK
jgi:hypothetical protein